MDWKVAVTLLTAISLLGPVMLAAQSKSSRQSGKPQSANKKSRQYINSPAHDPKWPFSDGVLAGNTLYISGKIGFDPKTRKAPADIDEEIKLLLGYFEDTLQRANMKMDDLVWVQVFCTDLSLFDRFNTAYRARFKGDLPARAFLGTDKLLLGGRFEIMGIAVKE